MELNREEIIRALEHCIKDVTCEQCPYSPSTCYIQEDALALIKELSDESQKWQEAYDCADSACRELSSKCDELVEENERLLESLQILSNNIDLLKEKEKIDTVQKMQEKILAKSEYGTINMSPWQLEQIAKEVLEGNDV